MGIWLLIAFCVCLFLGVPVFVCIGVVMFLPVLFDPGFSASAEFMVRSAVNGVDSTTLLALPLFILAGNIMGAGGISKRLFDVFAVLTGKRSGGIPIAVILTSVVYAAICGSGPAATAAVGAMAIPVMRHLKYKDEFSCVVSSAGGGIGIIIPPSMAFITYSVLSGSSVGDLFTAGFVPGLLLAAVLITFIVLYCRRAGEDKEAVAKNYEALCAKGKGKVFKDGILALLSPVIVLGGIYAGIVTPTEAAVISVFYSLIVCMFVYKSINLKKLKDICVQSIGGYAGIGIMMAFSAGVSRTIAIENIDSLLKDFVVNTFSSPAIFLAVISVIMLIFGMFLDCLPFTCLATPILVPILNAMGINLIHFGVIMTILTSVGMISPPYGINLFVSSGLAGIQTSKTFKIAIYFCIAYLIVTAILMYVPGISLFLVNILK